ncbi:putative phage abortive infection protein [Enterobacter wuhouensis]|uniref:putative phage abortive infection protein n=1 Tax=Enterobacter wuhouensis TaxID=2529381 RepID=UPI0035263902
MTDINSIIETYSTAAAAIIAAVSTTVAVKTMKKSSQFSRETLEATQKANARQTFEQRYTLLLTQHNALHAALCTYLDDKPEIKNAYNTSYEFSEYNNSIGGLELYFYFLTGHAVISPYMRILFHLLKHINADPYMADKTDSEKRLYSSPLRSCIRNDVSFLIAVNALNVRSNKVKTAGYPEYQKLLHKFNFFEHTVFTNPREPNEPYPVDALYLNEFRKLSLVEQEYDFLNAKISSAAGPFCGCFIENIKKAKIASHENYITYIKAEQRPQDFLPTPLLSCLLVYATPHESAFSTALERYLDKVYDICKSNYISQKAAFDKSKIVLEYIGGHYTYDKEEIHSINSLKVLMDLADENDFPKRVATVLMRPDMSISEGIKLSEIKDKIATYHEMQYIIWPQDETIFFQNLRKQISTVSNQALKSSLSSWQCKFDN